jgi:hypothetical protein
MIVVTSVRNDIAIHVVEGIFDPAQTAVLKHAYDRAADALARDYCLTEQAKVKLAKTVLRLARMSLAVGGTLASDLDVQTLASAARNHLLVVATDHAGGSRESTALFQNAAAHPFCAGRSPGGDPWNGDTASSIFTGA